MRLKLRIVALVLVAAASAVIGCGKSSSSGGSPPTPAQMDSNCSFVCADLLEGCPQPARSGAQTACVNSCKGADYAKMMDRMKTCSPKVASATGAKRCSAVNDCLAGK